MQTLTHENAQAIRPTSHILIEVNVPRANTGPVELVLKKCCSDLGDILLARDDARDKKSIRYTVLLSSAEEDRIRRHVNVLIAALKNGLISFSFSYVPLLAEIEIPPYQVLTHAFPLKERGSECYVSFLKPHAFYVSRSQDYLLDDDQLAWISQNHAQCHVL
ncbi:MAG TPA: hypothetical protein VHZ51_29620 [Ktedonobacteraceae bacterium]|nr:hypothetical protein [Ktedonobacteraceae bacterium]